MPRWRWPSCGNCPGSRPNPPSRPSSSRSTFPSRHRPRAHPSRRPRRPRRRRLSHRARLLCHPRDWVSHHRARSRPIQAADRRRPPARRLRDRREPRSLPGSRQGNQPSRNLRSQSRSSSRLPLRHRHHRRRRKSNWSRPCRHLKRRRRRSAPGIFQRSRLHRRPRHLLRRNVRKRHRRSSSANPSSLHRWRVDSSNVPPRIPKPRRSQHRHRSPIRRASMVSAKPKRTISGESPRSCRSTSSSLRTSARSRALWSCDSRSPATAP